MNVAGTSSSDRPASTTRIVAARVSKSSVPAGDVPSLVQRMHAAPAGRRAAA
ncbi:MAG: hypothetical protein IPK81_11885 [Rhodospirillales bacterium]|nr:MAG: hypothetical protein IPK81_11885 [Rhodospirillales bacterium]